MSGVRASAAEAAAAARNETAKAAAIGLRALGEAHADWWKRYWASGAFLTFEYTALESLFYLALYRAGSGARRGRAFPSDAGPWYHEGSVASGISWDWDLVSYFYLPVVANRPDVAGNLAEFLVAHEARLAANAPSDGSLAPPRASGLDAAAPFRPRATAANLLWALSVALDTRGSEAYATKTATALLPLLERALAFYEGVVVGKDIGALEVPPFASPGYPGPPGPNANYDLAWLRWGLGAAAAIGAAAGRNVSRYRALEAALPPYSYGVGGDGLAVYAGVAYDEPCGYPSHLAAVWPLNATGDPRLDAASIDAWNGRPDLRRKQTF